MKNSGLFKLRMLFGALLLVTTFSTGPYNSVVASPGKIPAVAPERQTNLSGPLTNQIIIKYRATVNATDGNGQIKPDRMNALSTAAGETLAYKRAMSGNAHVLRLANRMSSASVEAIARKLAALPDVEYAEPDYVMRPTRTPDDPSYAAQWHYHGTYGINAPAAWDITTGSASIRVAVIDTGITDHPDLAGRWVGGYDFIADVPTANDGNGRDSDPHDPGDWVTANMCGPGEPAENSSWHGTHVAGTIGAASDNGLGVSGINWVSPIVPVRVLGRCGGFTSDIVDGMRWAAGLAVSGVPANPNPAKVMNLSLGGGGSCSSTYQNAINAINAAGAIVVVSAGNSNANAANFSPASCNGVVTVAATDRDGNRTFYSNFGSAVEISAPGGETNTNSPSPAPQNGVLSTLNAGLTTPGAASYVYYQGTSMAAPHIAGVISLMVSLNPTLNFTQTLQLLQVSARPFPSGSSCTTSTCGSGIVDAAAALTAVLNPPPTSTAGPSLTPTNTNVPGGKATRTPTPTRTPTATRTNTPTFTVTPTATFTEVGPSATPTWTQTATATATLTHTATNTALPATATDVVSVPADLVKGFSPLIITSGGVSRLSVMILNPNPFSLTSASWVDNLPPGITIANPVNPSNLCGGTVAAVAGGTTLSLMGGSIPAQVGSTPGSCTVAIDVTSSTPGIFTNTIPAGALTTSNGVTNTISTSSTLTVLPTPATNTVTPLSPTASATPGTSDLIFIDGFESGNLAAWSSSMIDGGDLSVTPSAALLESQGLQAVIDDNNSLVVIDESPALETRYRTRFYFDPNSIPMAVGDAHLIFLGASGGGTLQHLQLELRFQATGFEVRALLMNDAKTLIATSWLPLSDTPHALELDWRAATAIGANNGGLTFWIDGVQQADLTGVDNDTRRIDQIRLGAVSGIDNGTRGTYFFDAFESRRLTYVGP